MCQVEGFQYQNIKKGKNVIYIINMYTYIFFQMKQYNDNLQNIDFLFH